MDSVNGGDAVGPAGSGALALPAPFTVPGGREAVRRALVASGARIVIIDDDPTGLQAVAHLPVISAWSDADIDWAIDESETAFAVLTNSRRLDADQARAANHEIGLRLAQRARRRGVDIRCISRSDSTLRGHFPGEVDGLIDGLAAGGQPTDGVLLCPAFLQTGRVTIDDVHYIRSAETLTPVAETEFAQDEAFGYQSSNLRDWAVGRGVDPARLHSLSLELVRGGGPPAVARELEAHRGGILIANAEAEADLDVLALGLMAAEERGVRMVARCGPSFVGARTGQVPGPPLSVYQVSPSVGPGLLVLDANTELTTRQLAEAQIDHTFTVIELAAETLGGDPGRLRAQAETLIDALRTGDTALVVSPHTGNGGGGRRDPALVEAIADALIGVIGWLPDELQVGWIVTTGGRTTCDLAYRALDAPRARVVGQIFPGLVSVWQLGADSRRPGVPYIVFPDNVGSETALSDALVRLKGF